MSERRVRYTNLDPGPYTFHIRAISSHGVLSAKETSFSFVVLPPFYATIWFRGLMGLGIVSSLGIAYWWRVRNLHRRHENLERQVTQRTGELQGAMQKLEAQARTLRELDSAKSKFFTNISHEFRTPLTLTLGPLGDVRAGLHGPISDEAKAEIDLAIRNTQRQLDLVDQLLMLARFDAGQVEFKPREIRLDESLRMTAAPYESIAKRQQTPLRLELPNQPVYVKIDEQKFEHLIGNLLSNAFKFTPPGGRVTLRLSIPIGGHCAIQVEDNGPGIPERDLPHIFERFYRGERAYGSTPGTGIGLALAREIVELHGGEIRAENRADGGSLFTVTLLTSAWPADVGTCGSAAPVAATAASGSVGMNSMRSSGVPFETMVPAAEVPAPQPNEASSNLPPESRNDEPQAPSRPNVLVVEDHGEMRAYLRKHLAPHYQLIEADRGDEGLKAVRAEMPDVVISDVMMPGLDGYDLCRAVKSDPETDFIPVILLTARADSKSTSYGLEGGADDYLSKPFSPSELLLRIRNLLLSRARLKARFVSETARKPSPQPTPTAPESAQELLLERLQRVLDRESQESSFDAVDLAGKLGMSRAQLYRRIKEAFGVTPSEMIVRFRLELAAKMLLQRTGNVGEIAYAVGFKNLSHFVKRFREQYGQTPAAYAASQQSHQDNHSE